MILNYQFCQALRTIPQNKYEIKKNSLIDNCSKCSGSVICNSCSSKIKLLDRYFNANIPIDFWHREMSNFKGDNKLSKLYNNISSNFKKYYLDGNSYLLKGNHGVGKTFFGCAVLKLSCAKDYNSLYTTMGDIVNVLVNGDKKVRYDARRELMMVAFLVLDEFDSRFIGSDSAAELFGRILESIIRIRLQNHMPTIMISNNRDPSEALGEHLGASMKSLITGYMKNITIIGSDFRESK